MNGVGGFRDIRIEVIRTHVHRVARQQSGKIMCLYEYFEVRALRVWIEITILPGKAVEAAAFYQPDCQEKHRDAAAHADR
jgi:hypothetical protein